MDISVVKYTEYQDLIDDKVPIDEVFIQELNRIKDSLDWKLSFDMMDILRKYNKFNPDVFIGIFPKILGFLVANINNLRSNLIKNALILIKEIFTYNLKFLPIIASKEPRILSDLLPLIYEKANNDKAFLKSEAKEAVKSFEKNGVLDENILKILLALTQEKNAGISEKASESLAIIITSKEPEILNSQTNKEVYASVLRISARLLDSNRSAIKKQGDEILGLLSKGVDFEKSLDELLEKKEKDVVILALEARKKAGSGKNKESLKDFLSKKKLG